MSIPLINEEIELCDTFIGSGRFELQRWRWQPDYFFHPALVPPIPTPAVLSKANTGTVTHSKDGDKNVLTLSDDFKVPETPDPHWQVVDSQGNVYLLEKLAIRGDKINKRITLPSYIHDIAKVQIWCAFAETNLGEAAFASPVM